MNVDFALLLTLATLLSGGIWALDALLFARGRRRRLAEAAAANGEPAPEKHAGESKLVEFSRSFFPVFLVVLLLRSFLYEPFRIPSGSMMPTLLIGDFILVNKYTYGIRLPVLNSKIIENNSPQTGDIIVFRFPEDGKTPFIKRVIGVPGDKITYRNKTLYINGKRIERHKTGVYADSASGGSENGSRILLESLPTLAHDILINPRKPAIINSEWIVPEGHYFVLGDNRDNSRDSRFWNFVPDENLIGKATAIWMSFDFERSGYFAADRIGTDLYEGE